MKTKFFIVLLLFISLLGNAQQKENFGLYTDRDLYVSGETLLLKLFAPLNDQAGIVHIDLISCGGKTITGIILEITDHQANGAVYLPDSLSSGSYILRTSTRSDKLQTVREIYVANRFAGMPESNSVSRIGRATPVAETEMGNSPITGLEEHYKRREKVTASIHLADDLLAKTEGNVHVSVSKTAPGYNGGTFCISAKPTTDQLIEKDGIILEGVVTDLKTAAPFKNSVVMLSIPGTTPGFNYYITGDDGRFFFKLKKYYGKIPVVLQCYDKARTRLLKISLVDSESLRSGFPAFETSTFPTEARKEVAKNIEAVTIRKIFNQQEIITLPAPKPQADAYPFYGIPTNTVDPKLFIDLPDFNEISHELLPGVKFRTYNRIPTIEVLSASLHNYFNEPPLVLLDGIPIQDLNIIKNLGSKKIDKVEICLEERHFGDLSFAGVVAIFSPKADDSLVPESKDLIKLTIEAIQAQTVLNSPSEQLPSEPDLRQVLLWTPSLKPAQTITLNFRASDIKGVYKLVLRGKTKDGSLFFKEQSFEVN